MRKLFVLLLGLLWTSGLWGQISISADMLRNPESEVKIKLLDSISGEPLQMATVYLQPKGDTTIMYFNLTDTSGVAVLDKVVRGSYNLTAEFLGYKVFRREYYFKKAKEDLGVIKLVEDAIMLEAATVSAVGNAIEMINDTIVYNATMFRTADNAALGELLQKMPGFEVAPDGSVTQNGVAISKITVNGKTFFFDDPSVAVKNLPAKIVEKIKVTDHKSETEKNTGIADMGKSTKEMDISLKKEYEQGWFGNAKLAAGAPVSPSDNSNQPLITQKDFLYNGSSMLSYYTPKDQLTVVANGYNVDNTGANDYKVYVYDGGRRSQRPSNGITEALTVGANYNTSRVKGIDISATANYKSNNIEAQKLSYRTTFLGNGNELNANAASNTVYEDKETGISVELKNDRSKKLYFQVTPKLSFSQSQTSSESLSQTERMNSSTSASYKEDDYFNHQLGYYAVLKDAGKKGRSFTLDGDLFISNEDTREKEYSEVIYTTTGDATVRNLNYENNTYGYGYTASLSYVEPLGKNWSLSTTLANNLNASNFTSDAFNNGTYDDYFSSVSDYRYSSSSAKLLAQYKGKATVHLGGSAEVATNENYSKSYGITQKTGVGENLWNWAPFVRVSYTTKDKAYYHLGYSGSSSNLSNSYISTVPNISDPTNISVGNIYLEPVFMSNLSGMYAYTNMKTFSSVQTFFTLSHSANSIVNANWFDENGIQYNVPVNSKKRNFDMHLQHAWSSVPLNKEKSLTFDIIASLRYGKAYGYQNVSRVEGMDIDNFDYKDFIQQFWGDASGNKFYSGQSGFKESRTSTVAANLNLSLRYKHELFTAKVGSNVRRELVDYTLNKDANVNTWNYKFTGQLQYDSKKQLSVISQMEYNLYDGYTAGFAQPSFLWNMELHKSIKSVTLSLYLKDILNQTSSFSRTTSANYVEDSYKNIIGQRILLGITFNFGKMNSTKNRSAQSAMFRMMM